MLTLTVTDAAGHSSVTNIGVIQSTVTLTMDSPTDPSQLWHPAMDVSGTISVSGYAVSVNGIAATVSGNAWSAPNVPVPPGGVASFTMLAISGGQTNANKSNPAKPDLGIIIQSDMQAATNHTDARREFWDVWNDGTCDETWVTNELAQHWTNGLGGSASSTVASDFWVGDWGWPIPGQWNMTRDPDYPGILLGGWLFPATNSVPYANYDRGLGAVPYGFSVNAPLGCEYCEVQTNYTTKTTSDDGLEVDTFYRTYKRNARTTMMLVSGGRGMPARPTLHRITGWVKHIPADHFDANPSYYDFIKTDVPPTFYHNLPHVPNASVHLLGNNTLHDDPNTPGAGSLYYVTPAGAGPIDCTPTVYGDNFYTWGFSDFPDDGNDTPSFSDTPYQPFITANSINITTNTPTFCVGQNIIFSIGWNGSPPYVEGVTHWTLPGTFVNTNPYPYCPTYYNKNADFLTRIYSRDNTLRTWCWYVRDFVAQSASVAMNLTFPNGQTIFIGSAGKFTVYRPEIESFYLSTNVTVILETNTDI